MSTNDVRFPRTCPDGTTITPSPAFHISGLPATGHQQPRIVVSGSIVVDHVMSYPGRFSDVILTDALGVIDLSLLVDKVTRVYGGSAPNIAYNLAMFGARPIIIGSAGADFQARISELQDLGVIVDHIHTSEDELTSRAFIVTDVANNQLTIVCLGAMRHAHFSKVSNVQVTIDAAIVAPNDPLAMNLHVLECKNLGIPFIYDPGSQIPRLSDQELLEGITGSSCVIGNEYEMALLSSRLRMQYEDLLKFCDMVVVTLGEHGSVIYTQNEKTKVPPATTTNVVDPTGAGDAYRAGLLLGWLKGMSPSDFGRVASLAGACAVEALGGQGHHFSISEFNQRLLREFDSDSMR